MKLTLPDDPKALETLYQELGDFLYAQEGARYYDDYSEAMARKRTLETATKVVDFLGQREAAAQNVVSIMGPGVRVPELIAGLEELERGGEIKTLAVAYIDQNDDTHTGWTVDQQSRVLWLAETLREDVIERFIRNRG